MLHAEEKIDNFAILQDLCCKNVYTTTKVQKYHVINVKCCELLICAYCESQYKYLTHLH